MRSSATALNSIPLPSHARPPVLPLYGPATRSNFQSILFSSARRNAGDVDARAHHRADVGDVKRLPVIVAECEVRRMVPFGLDANDGLARRIVHPDAAGPGGPDVPGAVALHAVGNAAL